MRNKLVPIFIEFTDKCRFEISCSCTTVYNDIIIAIWYTLYSFHYKLRCFFTISLWRVKCTQILLIQTVIQAVHKILEFLICRFCVWIDKTFEMSWVTDFSICIDFTCTVSKKITFCCCRYFSVISLSPSDNTVLIKVNRNIPICFIWNTIDKKFLYFCRIDHIHIIIFCDRCYI